jgi:hypothetical protein
MLHIQRRQTAASNATCCSITTSCLHQPSASSRKTPLTLTTLPLPLPLHVQAVEQRCTPSAVGILCSTIEHAIGVILLLLLIVRMQL